MLIYQQTNLLGRSNSKIGRWNLSHKLVHTFRNSPRIFSAPHFLAIMFDDGICSHDSERHSVP